MNRLHNICCCCVLILAGCLGATTLMAQGRPVLLDTCLISNTQRFKAIPLPGEFVPGSHEDLRACPSLGNNVVKIKNAKAGKASNLQVNLRIEGGKLVGVEAKSRGTKSFEKLYDQVIVQAGIPSKMVHQKGVLHYSWDLRFKAKATVEMSYDPATEIGIVVITPW